MGRPNDFNFKVESAAIHSGSLILFLCTGGKVILTGVHVYEINEDVFRIDRAESICVQGKGESNFSLEYRLQGEKIMAYQNGKSEGFFSTNEPALVIS